MKLSKLLFISAGLLAATAGVSGLVLAALAGPLPFVGVAFATAAGCVMVGAFLSDTFDL